MINSPPDISQAVMTATALADVLGLTVQRVGQLENQGILKKTDQGCYRVIPSVRAYCVYARNSSRGSTDRKAENKHRAALVQAKAEMAAMEAAKMRGDLVSAEGIRQQDFKIARILRNNLLSIPDRIAPIVAAETETFKVHSEIYNEITKTLNSIIEAMNSTEVDESTLDITRRDSAEYLATINEEHSHATDEHN